MQADRALGGQGANVPDTAPRVTTGRRLSAIRPDAPPAIASPSRLHVTRQETLSVCAGQTMTQSQ